MKSHSKQTSSGAGQALAGLAHRDYNTSRACEVAVSAAVAELELVRRTYRMSIESDIVERVNRAASKKQIPIPKQK